MLEQGDDVTELVRRMDTDDALTCIDGHSDYGRAIRGPAADWPDAVTIPP